MLGTTHFDWYPISVVASVLAALSIALVVDRYRFCRGPAKGFYYPRVVAICAIFAFVVLPLAYGIPVMIADLEVAQRLAQKRDAARQEATSGPATLPTSQSPADAH